MALPQALPASELTPAQRAFTLAGVLLGLLLAALDQTIVATAGPAIQADLHIAPAVYPWLTTSYLVASTVMLPIYGKLSDLYGRKVVLVAGIVLFVGASVLCALAGSTLALVLFRALQGLGSAALFTSAFTVVADLYPPAVRGKYQGLIGAVFALSSVVGPLVGGFLTDHFGWHWVFLVNVPVGAAALAFILARMPALRPPPREGRIQLDIAGALALGVAVVPLLLALSVGRGGEGGEGAGLPWGSWQVVGLFVLSALGVLAFVVAEARAPEPILDLALFRNRVFSVGNLAVFILGAGFLSAVVFLPLFMVNVVGLSATRSGLTVTPLTLGVTAGNVLAGQLVSRVGRYKVLMLASLGVLLAGYALMGFTLTPDSTQAEVTLKMVLVGVGIGPSLPLYTLAIQNAAPARQVGVATSSIAFFRQMGSTIGVAVLGTVFAVTLGVELQARTAQVLAEVPPAVREQLRPVASGGGGGEGAAAAGQVFSAAAVEERVHVLYEQRRQQARALEGGLQAQALARLEAEEAEAREAVRKVGQALKEAFTQATAVIYQLAVLIAALGILVTLFIPEQPLRKQEGPPVATD